MAARAWWSVGQIAILALWLGASTFFAASVAPALFAVLPSRSLAGEVVGRLLPLIFYSGMLIAALVIGFDVARTGTWQWGTATIASLVTIASCAIAQFI